MPMQIPKPPNPELAPMGASVRGAYGGGARGGYNNVANNSYGTGRGAGGMGGVANNMGGGGMGAMTQAMGAGMGNMGGMNPMVSPHSMAAVARVNRDVEVRRQLLISTLACASLQLRSRSPKDAYVSCGRRRRLSMAHICEIDATHGADHLLVRLPMLTW